MSRKLNKVVNAERGTRKAIVFRDYEEDKQGRRLKSRPYIKAKAAASNIIDADNRLTRNTNPYEMNIEQTEPEGDFEGIEMDPDWTEFQGDEEPSFEGKKVRPLASLLIFAQPTCSHKTPNTLLKSWLNNYSEDYLSMLFQSHAAPLSSNCVRCGRSTHQLYRCRHCLSADTLCLECMLLAHKSFPTHRVASWNGAFWEEASLSDLGLILYLGHCGEKCAEQATHHVVRVGDISGFFDVKVHYCAHVHAPTKPIQLLSVGLFPCSDIAPQSAFTLPMLEHYDLSTTLGAMSAQKYYNVLERMTEPGFPNEVADRYRELQWTHRRYCHLKNVKRSGMAYETHVLERHMQDHAMQCVACPIPGFNYNPETVPEEER
jgi:hypothetical protein